MKNLSELSDEELIEKIKESDSQSAISELFGRYKTTLKTKCRAFSSSRLDYEDLLQEGMIGLYTAIKNFNPVSGVPFNFFAKVCINHQILTALRSNNRKKNEILNNSLSLNQTIGQESNSDHKVEFISLISSKSRNPENILLDTERYHIIKEHLSPLENQIFLLFLDGYTYFDISKELKVTKKSVDNALQRIKKKLSDVKELKYD